MKKARLSIFCEKSTADAIKSRGGSAYVDRLVASNDVRDLVEQFRVAVDILHEEVQELRSARPSQTIPSAAPDLLTVTRYRELTATRESARIADRYRWEPEQHKWMKRFLNAYAGLICTQGVTPDEAFKRAADEAERDHMGACPFDLTLIG